MEIFKDSLVVWAAGDAHVGTDAKFGRQSLARALRQSEGREDAPGFPWRIMLDVGDLAGGQEAPDHEEGRMVLEQYAVMKEHHRAEVYNVAGNHDASGPGEETQWWFQSYGDPLGLHSEVSGVKDADRPFPVQGSWDAYRFQSGNVLFLMMSDRNDGGPPVGRGSRGGYPSGAVTKEQFDWWVEQVEQNQDKIIVTVHHHLLRETTVASGPWEGYGEGPDPYGAWAQGESGFHGYCRDGGPRGASYLYWCDGNPDAGAFERFLQEHPGAVDLWIGGHTHAPPGYQVAGRSHVEQKWGVTFLNCAALTQYHTRPVHRAPMSRILQFVPGTDALRIGCYLHEESVGPVGWHRPSERTVPLRHSFQP